MAQHWAFATADALIEKHPGALITCASGISPSGTVHAGNLREALTSDFVYRALQERGAQARLLFSWDNFDRFRKVPAGVSESYAKFIGMPYAEIPDPEFPSYAARYEHAFEESAAQLGISAEFIRQYDMYKAGAYDDQIRFVLNNRRAIADILARNMTQGMTEEQKEGYFPVSVYSRFTGKDATKVLSFDGDAQLTYRCLETGKQDTIDIMKEHQVKLLWKVDWPMRWNYEGVHFEPGGSDHATQGGSFDVASQISRGLFKRAPPHFVEYAFIRIKGMSAKMSSSKGNVISPADLLQVYPPEMVRWMYCKSSPDALIDIAFDSDVIRIYEEFDRKVAEFHKGTLSDDAMQGMILSQRDRPLSDSPLSFRQIAGIGDATNFNTSRIHELLDRSGVRITPTIDDRIACSRNWMDKYCPEARSTLLTMPNTAFYQSLPVAQRQDIQQLASVIDRAEHMTLDEIESALYAIPKRPEMNDDEKKLAQRQFFKNVYALLFGKERGPRLPTFVWASSHEDLKRLLGAHEQP